MVVWQGITEGGTAVPVQVTEAGKVVAQGEPGIEGPPGPPGPPGPQGQYGPGDDVDLGFITAEGYVTAPRFDSSNYPNSNSASFNDVVLLALRSDDQERNIITVWNGGTSKAYEQFTVTNEGGIQAANNQCGFEKTGELYFTSRGTRYKLEVAGGLCNAIPYTKAMQLKERAEDKRKPRPTDSVPED